MCQQLEKALGFHCGLFGEILSIYHPLPFNKCAGNLSFSGKLCCLSFWISLRCQCRRHLDDTAKCLTFTFICLSFQLPFCLQLSLLFSLFILELLMWNKFYEFPSTLPSSTIDCNVNVEVKGNVIRYFKLFYFLT